MIIYVVVLLFNVVQIINAGLVHNSYDIKLEDKVDFIVNELLKQDDYEMIKDNELEQFTIEDKENKLYDLHKLASKEYKRNAELKTPKREWFKGTTPRLPVITDLTFALLTMYQTERNSITKRKASNTGQDKIDFPYNYYDFIKEYYDESLEEAHSNHTFHPSSSNETKKSIPASIKDIIKFNTKTRNCTEEEIKHIGFKAVNCIIQDYKKHKEPSKVLAKRLFRIITIWFLVYVVVAIPLWCTRGWCCCCLFCKFFKPRETIDKAKIYFVKNPPGILTSSNGEQKKYDPTEYEVHSYEEFDHFITTL